MSAETSSSALAVLGEICLGGWVGSDGLGSLIPRLSRRERESLRWFVCACTEITDPMTNYADSFVKVSRMTVLYTTRTTLHAETNGTLPGLPLESLAMTLRFGLPAVSTCMCQANGDSMLRVVGPACRNR